VPPCTSSSASSAYYWPLAPTLYFWLSGLGLARVLVFLLLTVIGFIAGAQVPPPNLTRIPTDEC